jgi:hypothetical protein
MSDVFFLFDNAIASVVVGVYNTKTNYFHSFVNRLRRRFGAAWKTKSEAGKMKAKADEKLVAKVLVRCKNFFVQLSCKILSKFLCSCQLKKERPIFLDSLYPK